MSRILTLMNGSRVPFRSIQTRDAAALQELQLALSSESRNPSFFGHSPHLSDADAARLVTADGRNQMALVALDPADRSMIVGIVRLERVGDSRSAEYTAVIADSWRGSGVGQALSGVVLDRAAQRGFRHVFAIAQPEQRQILDVLKGLGRPWRTSIGPDLERVEIDLI